MAGWRSAAACALLLVAVGGAAAASTVVVQFDANSPPTMYRGPDGRAEGLYPTIVREVFRRLGRPVEVRAVPFKRLIRDLQSGRSAAGGVVWTPRREAFAAYSAPYAVERIEVYSRADGASRFTRLEDLHGRRVGVIRGWSYGEHLDEGAREARWQVEEVDSDVQNLSKLASGRIDYALVNRFAAERLMDDPRFAALIRGDAAAVEIGIHLALPREDADGALLRAFDAQVASMQADGTMAHLEAEARRIRGDARDAVR
ncbi:ABC transporter substrate-binding protein [Silanimonas algicola]